jgi:hypothetical protein
VPVEIHVAGACLGPGTLPLLTRPGPRAGRGPKGPRPALDPGQGAADTSLRSSCRGRGYGLPPMLRHSSRYHLIPAVGNGGHRFQFFLKVVHTHSPSLIPERPKPFHPPEIFSQRALAIVWTFMGGRFSRGVIAMGKQRLLMVTFLLNPHLSHFWPHACTLGCLGGRVSGPACETWLCGGKCSAWAVGRSSLTDSGGWALSSLCPPIPSPALIRAVPPFPRIAQGGHRRACLPPPPHTPFLSAPQGTLLAPGGHSRHPSIGSL